RPHNLTLLASLSEGNGLTVSRDSTVDKHNYHKPEIAFLCTTVRQHNRVREVDRMPAKAPWLLRIPEIAAMLEILDVPVVDRAMVERLFGLRRRRAIE